MHQFYCVRTFCGVSSTTMVSLKLLHTVSLKCIPSERKTLWQKQTETTTTQCCFLLFCCFKCILLPPYPAENYCYFCLATTVKYVPFVEFGTMEGIQEWRHKELYESAISFPFIKHSLPLNAPQLLCTWTFKSAWFIDTWIAQFFSFWKKSTRNFPGHVWVCYAKLLWPFCRSFSFFIASCMLFAGIMGRGQETTDNSFFGLSIWTITESRDTKLPCTSGSQLIRKSMDKSKPRSIQSLLEIKLVSLMC